MPSIRKKTSNRLKIHDRERLKKRVKDSKKKKSKAAKKNPQWKSKDKDPGIPNDFPYKDQILAEVAQQRRADAEEKERKKEEKRLARLAAKGITPTEPEGTTVSDDDDAAVPAATKKDLNVGAEAIAGLSAKVVSGEMKARPAPEKVTEEESEDEDAGEPALVNRDLETMRKVLEEADVVLQVVDARDPLEYRTAALERQAKELGKKFAVVLNKIDLCPREAVSAWVAHLRPQHPTFLFRSSTAFLSSTTVPVSGKGKSKTPVNDALGAESVLGYLHHLAKAKKGDAPLTVAVAGVTNVGKSAVINSLARRAALPVYSLSATSRGATTTELPQEVTVEANGKEVRIIDTPGLAFEVDREAENKEEQRGRDILLRSRGRIDKLKDAAPPLSYMISRANNEDLMLLYNLAAFAKNDPTAFLSGVARSHQLIKKRGELDLTGASRIVLRDWSVGKFSRYATPPKVAAAASEQKTPSTKRSPKKEVALPKWLAALYAADEAVLEKVTPRKELRKAAGLVRFTTGAVDEREVNLEREWAGVGAEESEDEDEDGEGMEVDEEDVEDEEEEEVDEEDDEEVEEEEEVPVPEPKKRKRGQNVPVPSRKVVFAKKVQPKTEAKAPAEAPPSILKKKTTTTTTVTTTTEEEVAPRPVKKQKKQAPTKPLKVANATSASKKVKENAAAAADGSSDAYNFAAFF
ncbi:hypothetical protein D9611_002927 [Ephemerocybe angulata]|uniref:CP-type G domain-containing protein n=1 Tax=Ephemerocybe angulata TaxID=980116 RepID=A0A8H5C9G3_9AGAR|nr:hypothetical protein D9611_002927 [Tulosesus angulatus]